jgi:hypothetical protein
MYADDEVNRKVKNVPLIVAFALCFVVLAVLSLTARANPVASTQAALSYDVSNIMTCPNGVRVVDSHGIQHGYPTGRTVAFVIGRYNGANNISYTSNLVVVDAKNNIVAYYPAGTYTSASDKNAEAELSVIK